MREESAKATAQAARVLDETADKITLSGDYVRSDSGSPVLDSDGRVIGLMIEATNQPGSATQGIAIPVTRFASILSGPTASPIARKAIPSMAELGGTRPTSTAVDAIEIAVSGCVFLGKRSARLAKNTPDMPFGLSTLQILLDADKRGFLMGTRLSPDIAVNLRSDCPVVESGSAYYSPARVQLKPGDRVTLSEILPLNYLDDVFFWARVTARGSNSGSNDSNAGIDPSAAPADAGSLQIGERDVCGSALLGLLTVIGQRHAGVCPRPWPMHELG